MPGSNFEFEKLVKLLRMTTSSNDVEALLFMRKANEQLAKLGWDWDELLRGKVTVMADPFSGLTQPYNRADSDLRPAQPPPQQRYTPPPPPPPQSNPQPAWTPPQRPTTPKRPATTRTGRTKPKITLSDLGL